MIGDSHPVLESVERIVNKGQTSKSEQNEQSDDADDNINTLAKRVHYTLQQISSKEFASNKKANSK